MDAHQRRASRRAILPCWIATASSSALRPLNSKDVNLPKLVGRCRLATTRAFPDCFRLLHGIGHYSRLRRSLCLNAASPALTIFLHSLLRLTPLANLASEEFFRGGSANAMGNLYGGTDFFFTWS